MEGFLPIIAGIVRDCLQFDPALRPTANDVAERLVRWQFRQMDLERDERGNTYLHRMVAAEDHWDVTILLASQKPVMVNAVNNAGDTPLMLAGLVSAGMLLQYQKVPPTNEEPSRVAELFHNIDIFGALLKLVEKQDVERINQIGKYLARYFRDGAHSFQKISLHEQKDSNGETPLHIAARLGNSALFDALLSLKVFNEWNSNDEGRTALHVASVRGHADIIKTLVTTTDTSEEKGDVKLHRLNTQDKIGKTALHLAAASGNVSAIRALLNCTATNVNLRDFEERPPMFDITLVNNNDAPSRDELVDAFVHHPDIDLNLKDSTGETMLHKVARHDLAQSAKIILKHPGTDIFVREKEHKYEPIQLAVREKSFRVAAMLLSKWDTNVNESDKYSNTLLHLLAAACLSPGHALDEVISMQVSFAEKLVSRDDVDLNLCNLYGDTALHIAIEKKQPHGGRSNTFVTWRKTAH